MLKPTLQQYIKKHGLFTRGTPDQFDRMCRLHIHDIATCIWLYSETDKTAADIERELTEGGDTIDW